MILINNYPGDIYWRTFNATDVVRWVGFHDGIIRSGEAINIREDQPHQCEIKAYGLYGQLLKAASTNDIYNSDDGVILLVQSNGLVVDNSGMLTPVTLPPASPTRPAQCENFLLQIQSLQEEFHNGGPKAGIAQQIRELQDEMAALGC